MAMGCQCEAQGEGSGRGRVAGLGGVGAPTNPDTRPRPGPERAPSPRLLTAMEKEAMDVLWRWDGAGAINERAGHCLKRNAE